MLDFHRLDNKDYLFGLDDRKYNNLSDVFDNYRYRTGVFIDQYGDTKLTVENQKLIVKIIDDYIGKTNLNPDKQKTVDILEVRALLKHFSANNIEIEAIGD